jgi:integrase/recombinase XerD
VAQAVDAYLADAVSRSVETSTLKKLETIFRKQFLAWTRVEGIEYLDELELDTLLNFRNTWEDGPLAKQKKQSRVIGFFWACVRRRYLTENPAIGLGKIKVVQIPTDYFPPDEFERIIAATYIRRGDRGGGDVKANQTRLRTMTLLMRWSGLRIRDAVTLERHRLNGDSLLLYQAKTGTPVYVPLPPHVVEALENIPPGPKPNPRYFFWSGNGDPKSAVADWQRSYRRLFKSADIRTADGERKRCHPHMFRDTFAVEMLLAGVPIDQVSLLLGHASVKITEKSYAPFVKARHPAVVVVDSFRTMVRKPQSDMDLQSFIQRLALFLASWQATTFLIGEYAEEELRDNPIFTVADGLFWLRQTAERNSIVRKLQVVKLRGQDSVPGLHTFRITEAGVQAFSRTFGLTARKRNPPSDRRLSFGIAELDKMLGGGVREGDSVLVAGSSGTGKSVLATQFIAEGIRQGEPGIVAVFEERPQAYAERAASLGLDLETPQKDGKLTILYLRPARSLGR